MEEQERLPGPASEQALLVPQEQAQESRPELELAQLLGLQLGLVLEQQPESSLEAVPVQPRVELQADWQVAVPSLHLTLALSSCIHSSPEQ